MQFFDNGGCFNLTHQTADILHLTFEATMLTGADIFAIEHRCFQLFGQFQFANDFGFGGPALSAVAGRIPRSVSDERRVLLAPRLAAARPPWAGRRSRICDWHRCCAFRLSWPLTHPLPLDVRHTLLPGLGPTVVAYRITQREKGILQADTAAQAQAQLLNQARELLPPPLALWRQLTIRWWKSCRSGADCRSGGRR